MDKETQLMEFFCKKCGKWVTIECGGENAPACPECGGRELVPAPREPATAKKVVCTCCCADDKGGKNG